MKKDLTRRNVQLQWICGRPESGKKIALLIPQYNEGTNSCMQQRLEYFAGLARRFKNEIDVILIDDGSTDNSLKIMKKFHDEHPGTFSLVSITPNANKVGALYLTARSISHELIILSDFDTDIHPFEEIFKYLDILECDANLMGLYFRMVPFEGSGPLFLFQQLEYSLHRTLYQLHMIDQSVPVMPGAGSCYKREVLISIYEQHSGLRSGEDREATLIGQKLGYGTIYIKNICTLTRPPLTFPALIRQRVRWNLGYLETFYKERKFYFSLVRKFNVMGMRVVFDALLVQFTVLMPFILLALLIFSKHTILPFLFVAYLISVLWPLNTFFIIPAESMEFKGKRFFSMLFYPVCKATLDCFAWFGAMLAFIKNKALKKYDSPDADPVKDLHMSVAGYEKAEQTVEYRD